jgi:chromosome segregation ATPase
MSNPITAFVNGVRDMINSSAFQTNPDNGWRIIYTGANNLDEKFQTAKEEQAKLAADLKTAKEEQVRLAADLNTAKEMQAKLADEQDKLTEGLELTRKANEVLEAVIDRNRDKFENEKNILKESLKNATGAVEALSDTRTKLNEKITEQADVISDLSEENKELKDEINTLKRQLEETMAGGKIMSKKAKH